MMNHRGKVDLGDVVFPVDDRRIAAQLGLVGIVEIVVKLHQIVDAVQRLTFGVRTVDLHVPHGPLDLVLLILDLSVPHGLPAPQR